jgi:hypothetical protein
MAACDWRSWTWTNPRSIPPNEKDGKEGWVEEGGWEKKWEYEYEQEQK